MIGLLAGFVPQTPMRVFGSVLLVVLILLTAWGIFFGKDTE